MDDYEKDKIVFNVNGENTANKILNYACPLLLEEFKPYLNKKVLKTDETLLKEIKTKTDLIIKQTEKKFNDKNINIGLWLNCSKYSIYLEVRIRFNRLEKHGFLYYSSSKYLIDIDFNLMGISNKIKGFYDFKPLEKINLNKQLKIFDECLNLKNKLDVKRRELKPYSLQDFIK